MPASPLTGSRIRERRLARGTRQADLARAVGISPAYLNLIEHNRRRIGGKLIVDIARELGVEPTQLTEGAEDALMVALRDAAARSGEAGPGGAPELDRAEDFAGRFPGWAALVATQGRRIEALERLVETLSDRLAHDPHLAASLHEVLSAVTAIRSAASILTETRDIDPDWQARFLRNVGEESRRLSESAEGLVAWLDTGGDVAETPLSPVDELGAFVARADYHFPTLEAPGAGAREIGALLKGAEAPRDPGTAEMARAMLSRYHADARAMPAGAFTVSRAAVDGDPSRLAAAFDVPLDAVLRRMASLGGDAAGLVVCDGAGTLTLRKPVEGFVLPRFGGGCPLWPLYQALTRPAQPVAAVLEMPGRIPRRFRCRAVSLPLAGTGFDAPTVHGATMLIEPVEREVPGPLVEAGSTCRVCPRESCPARREPSILGARVPAAPRSDRDQ
ncbi:XRE family transcriptional regulator [Sinisalibacter lacisalsi]|uniref:XRE family transcriptional regulator n=1 Tax=Sinisalibacter lacisalsi TaxID=1526570 RepID=A0ABQ1QTI7_9RHOB|nr:XRE family transcriptional regulator [Sinisalibacter lacisalsi]GGD44170.1 XRE family transcriptional regulator [Sinisalibacter lacisalsi]